MQSPIQTALLAYGMSGSVFHGPLLAAHGGFNIKKIVQRRSNESIARYPATLIVRSPEEIFDDPTIELVIINTPNHTHFDYATKALEAGKHIVVEKPVTTTSAEAEKLIAIAKKKDKILTVFQNRRWDGDFMTVKKVLDQRLLGKVVEFESHYDRYRNYIESNTWKEEPSPGAGILYNLGSHMIDQVLLLFGMPRNIDARIGINRQGGIVDDYYDIRMEYSDMLVILKSSYLVREEGPRYIVHGTQGSFVKYGIDPQEQALKDGQTPGTARWGVETKNNWGKLNTSISGLHFEGSLETIPGNYLAFYQNVYESIRQAKPLAVKAEESLMGIKVIEAALESNKLKRSIILSSNNV